MVEENGFDFGVTSDDAKVPFRESHRSSIAIFRRDGIVNKKTIDGIKAINVGLCSIYAFCIDNRSLYMFDGDSLSEADNDEILMPVSGRGRWIKQFSLDQNIGVSKTYVDESDASVLKAAKKYTDDNTPTFQQKQTDWESTDTESPAYIKNKPSIPNTDSFIQDKDYVHTDENYTREEKKKLAGITEKAQENVIEKINVNGKEVYIQDKTVEISTSGLPSSNRSGDRLVSGSENEVKWLRGRQDLKTPSPTILIDIYAMKHNIVYTGTSDIELQFNLSMFNSLEDMKVGIINKSGSNRNITLDSGIVWKNITETLSIDNDSVLELSICSYSDMDTGVIVVGRVDSIES